MFGSTFTVKCPACRARQTNPQAQVVVITGYHPEEEPQVRRLLSEGAHAVFEKPFNVPKLLEALRQLTSRQPADEPRVARSCG
jgi:CheY-like chemotaxis protein